MSSTMSEAEADIDPRFLADWSGLQGGRPREVLRPTSTAEVSAILQRCHAQGQRVTIQGGMTGVSGGAVPDAGDVVINLERMNRIESLDELEGLMQVQAGATLQSVQEAATAAGWHFAVDLGARGSCQMGGNASTNAGGIRVLRFGTMRDQVLGVEAVLADGTIVESLGRLIKNSTGLEARQLFVGTEGTLGVITRLTLRLHPPMGEPQAAWVSASRFEHLPALLRRLRQRLGSSLCAFEFMSGDFVALASQLSGTARPPADSPWHVLVEVAGEAHASVSDLSEALQASLADAVEAEEIEDAAIATSLAQREAFWRLREAIPEVLTRLKPAGTYDVGLPWRETGPYVQEVDTALRTALPAARHLFLGHLGDNNLHLICGPLDDAQHAACDRIVYEALRGRSGTVSAEHGVGRLKKEVLSITRGESELALTRRIKMALDPAGILNAGRVLD